MMRRRMLDMGSFCLSVRLFMELVVQLLSKDAL